MENGSKKIGLRIAAGVLVAITIIIAVFASGITLPTNQGPTGPTTQVQSGILNVFLIDAPVELNHLNITITDLEVHKAGEDGEEGKWIVLVEDGVPGIPEFDLLYYQDGRELHLASNQIETGNYTKIRMYISKAVANKTDDPSNPVNLTVPSGKIDVITKFEIGTEERVDVTIDMEPDWIAISKSGNLRPVLKATIQTLTITDTIAPTYESISHSNSTAGATCYFNVTIDDNVALESGGEYQFATNNTGSWVWDSAVSFSSTPQTVSISKTLNSTMDMVVGYRWNMTDNEGNSNSTTIYTLTITDDSAIESAGGA